MATNRTTDATPDAIAAIQAAIDRELAGKPAEQRRAARRAYPMIQLVTPMANGAPIDAQPPRHVMCRDISQTGMAFLWPGPVKFDEVAIDLAAPNGSLCLAAKVKWSRAIGDGDILFLVGCHFIRKLATPQAPA